MGRAVQPPDSGFSLIEVLVAVAIVAIALAAGSRAAGSLLNNAQRLSDVTAAQWCADNRLVNLKLARLFPAKKNKVAHHSSADESSDPYAAFDVNGNPLPVDTKDVKLRLSDGDAEANESDDESEW
eukprot:gene21503-29512_t